MSKVDVIIPVYGKPIYLIETIKSVVNQAFVRNIIIVLDRVDKDFFANLNLNHDNLVVVSSETPGIVAALNLGLENSKAELVARIDSDDIMLPGRISKQLEFLVSNPDYVCVGTSIEIFGNGTNNKIKKYPRTHNKIINQLTYQNSLAHPAVMYRRESVLSAGGYRAVFEGAEDYDLWFRLSKIGKLYNLEEPFTKYRINLGQYSSKFSSYRSELDSLVRIFNMARIEDLSKDFYNELIPINKIIENLEIYSQKIKINQPKLFKKLSNAQEFGSIINFKTLENRKIKRNFALLFYLIRLIIVSPIFSIKIILARINK
jgi:glycosyltransferase involved in cell wall biosynthesis